VFISGTESTDVDIIIILDLQHNTQKAKNTTVSYGERMPLRNRILRNIINICLILLLLQHLLFVTTSYDRNDTTGSRKNVMLEKEEANNNLTQNDQVHPIEDANVRTLNDENGFIVDGEQDVQAYDKCDNVGSDCTINQPNVAVIGKYLIRYHGLKARKGRSLQLHCHLWVQMFSTKHFFCPILL